MTLDSFLAEMNFDVAQDQRNFAMSQGGVGARPAVTIEKVQTDAIKNVLGHVYRPTEYSVGVNGTSFDVSVGTDNFSGPFDKVLKSCVEIVVKPQRK